MFVFEKFLFVVVMCGASQAYKRGQQVTPPEPEHTGYYVSEQTAKEIGTDIVLYL